MKMKELRLKNDEFKNDEIHLSVVNKFKDSDFDNYYSIFDLKKPIKNIGLIGVDDGEDFAIKFKSLGKNDFAFAIYLDGVNASQSNRIQNLSSIPEEKRTSYSNHNSFTCRSNGKGGEFFLDRYSQKSDQNRRFVFTTKANHGINEVLINDPSKLSRIEIYLWIEEEVYYDHYADYLPEGIDDNAENSPKIGAGNATNKKFTTSNGLDNPKYFGKIMFIYLASDKLKHLGNTKISKLSVENFDFDDPMDLVPKG
jgi:hypothetical protein